MWELEYKESWVPKNWCFWTVVLEKTLESPLNSKEIQPVHPKGHQSWVFIGRTYAEAKTPILWPPDVKSGLIWKDPDAGKDWGQEEKGMTEDEMAVWHHWLNGHGFGQTPGVGDGQWGLECCSSWGRKELDTTEQVNWTDFVDLFPSLVFLDYISLFNSCCKAGLVILNSLNVCLSEMLFISPSILNEILTGYSNLGCRCFPISTLNISCHSLLACNFCWKITCGVSLVHYLLLFPCCF